MMAPAHRVVVPDRASFHRLVPDGWAHRVRLSARLARGEVVAGTLRGPALQQRLLAVPAHDRDVWVDELLGLGEPPPDVPDLPAGAVPYLPCGVEEILTVALDIPLRPDDELVDIGSGQGKVVLLAHLLTGVRARGVELQEPLVRCALAVSAEFQLENVSFTLGNAIEVPLEGSIFFLYSPCNGELLSALLGRLEELARRKPIVVCAAGFELPGVRWLEPRRASAVSVALYESLTPGVPGRWATAR
jgi:hypothetical protein